MRRLRTQFVAVIVLLVWSGACSKRQSSEDSENEDTRIPHLKRSVIKSGRRMNGFGNTGADGFSFSGTWVGGEAPGGAVFRYYNVIPPVNVRSGYNYYDDASGDGRSPEGMKVVTGPRAAEAMTSFFDNMSRRISSFIPF